VDLGCRDLVVAGPGLRPRPWPALALDRARFVGEAVAVVWADGAAAAEDLAEAVAVDWQPLEPEPPETVFDLDLASGDLEAAFAGRVRVRERTYRTARQTPLPLEPRAVLAAWDGGRLTLWSSTQVPSILRRGVALALDLDETAVRVKVPEVGGGFGQKAHVFPEEIVVAALARRLARPVRWSEDRRESLIASVHAHDDAIRLRVAFRPDGCLVAVDAEVTADVGAYSVYPFSASLEPATCAHALFAAYRLEALRVRARALTSHRCPVGAYRGVGTNAAVFAAERMLDAIAAEVGIDPLEVRRRNVHAHLPVTTLSGRELESGDYPALLDRLESRAGYADLRRRQAAARAEGRLFGIGLGVFNEHSGTGRTEYQSRGVTTVPGTDGARVRVLEEGRITVATSAVEIGQGITETIRAVAAREMGVEPARVEVLAADTDVSPEGTGSFVSRGAVGLLAAVVDASRQAAELDLAPGTEVSATVDPRQVFPAGAHLAVVEVDPDGYVPRVVRYVAVEDCGTIVDPLAVDAQIRGGVAMGISKVLLEECPYDAEGQPLAATMLDYLVALAPDVPAIEIEHLESPSPLTRLGSKGVGEAGTVGAFGAVANAVADALAPLGVELRDLPMSPGRIFEAVVEAETATRASS
ncbi:MAG: molybdopterin-dependent oxidoreductase, partial [Candidatus Dormibacteraeota bacterium]|nr:molybdopterin-dependent oxidoreductase [Candidatus Dormibacteraeota bacterium]